MEIIVKKKINGNVVEFTANERDFKESLLKLGHLLEDDYCWLEGFQGSEVKWRVKKAVSKKDNKAYTYIERHCWAGDKHAKSTLGQYQDNSGYFWKKWELVEKFDGKDKEADPLEDSPF
jgi:uncharacterized damage-inducible protein DinB